MKQKLVLLFTFALVACAPSSQSPKVQKNNYETLSIKSFEAQGLKNLRMTSLTLFLWKEGTSDLERAEVFRKIQTYDLIEEASLDYSFLQEKMEQLKVQENESSQVQAIQTKVDELIAKFGSQDKMMEAFGKMPSYIEAIQNASDWLEQESAVIAFNTREITQSSGRTQDMITIEIEGIKFPESSNTKYSTLAGNVSDVSYKSTGAVMEFVVRATNTDLYFFKLHRTNYDDKSNRIIFKGDIIYKKLNASGEVVKVRRGQAKIADRAN